MSKIIKWLLKTSILEVCLKGIGKLQLKVAGAKPTFPMSDYHLILDDVLIDEYCTIYTFATADVSNIVSTSIRKLTDGDFNHTGLIIFNEKGLPMAFHVTTDGLVVEDFLEVLRDIDYLCINKLQLQPDDFDKAYGRIEFLHSIIDKIKYDYSLSMGYGDDRFYCSEATYFVLDGLYEDIDLAPQIIYGVSVFPPNQMTKLGEIIYTNHPLIEA